MIIRRTIAVLGAIVFVAVAFILGVRVQGGESARAMSFHEDASAVPLAFKRALGPNPAMVQMTVEPHSVAADVLMGEEVQSFVLHHGAGYVVAGPRRDLTDVQDRAFVPEGIRYDRIPAVAKQAAEELGDPDVRLIIDRAPGSRELRWRAQGAAGELVLTP